MPSYTRSKTLGTPAKNVGFNSMRSSLISFIFFMAFINNVNQGQSPPKPKKWGKNVINTL